MSPRTILPNALAELLAWTSLRELMVVIVIIALVVFSAPLAVRNANGQDGQSRLTWVERRSPGVFDDFGPDALIQGKVRYQVNATILIPLFIASIPLVSRTDVGVGSFTVTDFEASEAGEASEASDDRDDGVLRAYEFFAASIPDRARGLNRLGFIREVAKLGGGGTQWTAQFGVISADRAQTRAEAEESFGQDKNLQPYKIIDTMIEPQRNYGTVTTLTLDGLWKSAAALYADVRPMWATVPPEASHELEDPGGVLYDQPVGFLGAIQLTLRRVATMLAEGKDPTPFSCPYIHKGQVFQMEFRDHKIDRRRQATYLESGLVTPSAVVHKLEYRVMNDEGDEEESFELWTELPSENASDPLSPPIFPIAFEFKPRSYLELRAVQVAASPGLPGLNEEGSVP